jgi:hypothetical protein
MRKIVYVALMLLAVAGATSGPIVEAAASACSNLPANCSCGCNCGQLQKCCTSGGVKTCQPVYDPNILCPQIACI